MAKKYRTSGNSRVTDATWTTLIGSKAFRVGYEDKHKGRAFDPDRFRDARDQWNYERGRLLACTYTGPLKNGRKITYEAIIATIQAVDDKAFI
jgi:hypothetical protein